ncbi:hypothetical protein SAMN05421773_11928 [Streptomyces aidingensis]|uniref:Uncharacterized protein n=1 Tax=Streptomyces aidingensis TaxID=910347 RepID=A0A1I1TBD6_9ACTN|nr:hypothetical protein SAMN05421773_11928 [Streptomyces aidingensis]
MIRALRRAGYAPGLLAGPLSIWAVGFGMGFTLAAARAR